MPICSARPHSSLVRTTSLLVTAINIDVEGFSKFDGQYDIESSTHRIKRNQVYTTESEARLLSS